jgi:hypothetical protein
MAGYCQARHCPESAIQLRVDSRGFRPLNELEGFDCRKLYRNRAGSVQPYEVAGATAAHPCYRYLAPVE